MENFMLTDVKSKFMHHVMLKHSLFIVWEDEYDLGIKIIDEHHRALVAMINSLSYGILNNYDKKILRPLSSMIFDYTRIHFEVEEQFLEEIDFTDAQAHRALHCELLERYKSVSHDFLVHKDSHEFLIFLRDWWINHICHEDLKYKEFLLTTAENKTEQ